MRFLSGSDFQFVHQFVVGIFIPGRKEGGIKPFDFFDRHKCVLYVPFDQQSHPLPGLRIHVPDIFPEYPAFSGMGL